MPESLQQAFSGVRQRAALAARAALGPLDAPEPVRDTSGRDAAAEPPQPEPILEVDPSVPRADRLVESPVFILASMRSGSTLLRMLLNSHSRIRAPHELHLQTLAVMPRPEFSERALHALDLERAELEHVLWDRIFDIELRRSGKETFVEKTPGNAWLWKRLSHAWPKARFIILLRHPAAVMTSAYVPQGKGRAGAHVLKYARPVEEARRCLENAITVRYEDLTSDPEAVTKRLCAWLGHDWEPGMLDYGARDQGPDSAHMGDRSEKIRAGTIAEARIPANGIDRIKNPDLRAIAEAWGYT